MASLAGLVLLAGPAQAQKAPDAGTLLRDFNGQGPKGIAPLPPPIAVPSEAPLPTSGNGTVYVSDFHIVAGDFPESVLKDLVKSYLNRALTLNDLETAARLIGDYYRQHDLLARAFIPKQTVKNGVVEIDVQEATLGQVKIDPSSKSRFSQSRAAGIVGDRAPPGQPLRPSQLEEGVQVLNEVPGVAGTASMAQGQSKSQTDTVIKLTDTPEFSVSGLADNESGKSVGANRGVANLVISDGLGLGDQSVLTAMGTQGSRYGRVGFTAPVGDSGLTLGLDGSGLSYYVVGSFASSQAKGFATTGELTAAYPITRSSTF